MPGFLYFLPTKAPAVSHIDMKAWGLDYAVEGRLTACGCTNGPKHLSGFTVADEQRVPVAQIGYYADRQTWFEMDVRQGDGPQPWVGYYTDDPPKPRRLCRAMSLPGHQVRLNDGNEWLVPVAIEINDGGGQIGMFCALPATAECDGKGGLRPGAIDPRYARLWELACEYWDVKRGASLEGNKLTMDYDNWIGAGVEAVAANYVVGRWEMTSCLQAFTEATAAAVLDAVIDWPKIIQMAEKKMTDLASSNTADGQKG